MYVCSWTPKSNAEEPNPNNLEADEQFFNEVLWPKLAFRVPIFSKLKVRIDQIIYYCRHFGVRCEKSIIFCRGNKPWMPGEKHGFLDQRLELGSLATSVLSSKT